MITMKQFMEAIQYKVDEGSSYGWDCFGPKAYMIDSNGKDDKGFTFAATITFDLETQEVYSIEVCDFIKHRAYRLMNSEYKEAHSKESRARSVNGDQAWDNVDYLELEDDDDMLEKLTAIAAGEAYDTKITIHLDLDAPTQDILMSMAKKKGMTISELVEEILSEYLTVLILSEEGEQK